MCVGCLSMLKLKDLEVNTGKGNPTLGQKIFGAAMLGVVGYFLADSWTEDIKQGIPICDKCLSQLTDVEKLDLDKPVELFSGRKKVCRYFTCEIKKKCAQFIFKHEIFALALKVLNSQLAFESLEVCLDADIPDEHPIAAVKQKEEGLDFSSELNPTLPEVPQEKKDLYQKQFNHNLSPYDLAIIYSWNKSVEGIKSIYIHPDIPEKKISNAKKKYVNLLDGEFVIGLQDSTTFGSAKDGFVVTNRAIHWRRPDSKYSQRRAAFLHIEPFLVEFDRGIFHTRIVVGKEKKNRIDLLNILKDEDLESIASFIRNAAMIRRCRFNNI